MAGSLNRFIGSSAPQKPTHSPRATGGDPCSPRATNGGPGQPAPCALRPRALAAGMRAETPRGRTHRASPPRAEKLETQKYHGGRGGINDPAQGGVINGPGVSGAINGVGVSDPIPCALMHMVQPRVQRRKRCTRGCMARVASPESPEKQPANQYSASTETPYKQPSKQEILKSCQE
jgi:hypothetical protein